MTTKQEIKENKIKRIVEELVEQTKMEDEVKDIEFTMNTLQTGYASHITDNINGTLESVTVVTSKQIQMTITLENLSEITLFDTGAGNIFGQVFLPLRVHSISPENEKFNMTGGEKWVLNNKLRFEVAGAMETEVKVIVRYKS